MAPSNNKRKRDDESPLTRQDNTSQPVKSSLLQSSEETSFPRGGASVLTPLELKQVANEAASDVLFDNSTSSAAKPEVERPKKKKKTSKSTTGTKNETDEEESTTIVEHISFKNLTPGSQLLGQISAVNKHDLCISLSDNLCGYVTLANISEQFTNLLEELDETMEKDQDSEDDDSDYDSSDEDEHSKNKKNKELPDLKKYFKSGQWLRCTVQSNTALEAKKKQKRIELTIEPSATNQLADEDLSRNCTVQCSVKSIEDHGAILDLGVKGITGFISKKDYPGVEELLPGTVFLGNVAKRSDRTVNVNFDFTSKNNKVSHISSIDAVIPGQSVDFLCQKISSNGIFGKTFGLVSGFLGVSHLRTFSADEIKHNYAIGSNIKARIVATLTNKKGEKIILVSTLPHILSLETKILEADALDAFPVGYILESCTVKGRDSQYFYLSMDQDRIGQVHISRVGDEDPAGEVKARVMGYNVVDGYYQLSTDPKVLELKYLRTKDIPLGEVISGCEIVTVSDKGIQLTLFGSQFKAFVPPLHISDVKLVYPERKFKIGSKVKGRVLNVDNRGRVTVTLKKSLVNLDEDEIKLVSNFKQIEKLADNDEKTSATVEFFKTNGCVVSFLGNLKGFLPNGEISEAFVKRPQDHLRLGQTVMVKVLQHDEEKNRVIVTCKVSSDAAAQQKDAIENMVIGRSIVTVTVVEKTKDSAVIELVDVGLRGVIYVGHLSDSRIEQNRAQLKKLRVGTELEGLVIDKDIRTRVFNLSCKKSLIKDAQNGLLPLSYDEVKAKGNSSPMHGYVKSFSDKGIFVAFSGRFVGLVLPSYAVESRDVDISKKFYINQSITAYLLRTDDENERFLLALKEPKVAEKRQDNSSVNAVNPIDESVKELSEYVVGKVTKAKIKAVKKNQLNVLLADNLHGRVDVSEIFDKFEDIKDTKAPLSCYKKGDVIEVKVIGYHDIKTHRFLPISHRASKNTILELTAKPSRLTEENESSLTIKNVEENDELVGFVNNFSKGFLWLTLSPVLKAKISNINLSDDGSTFASDIPESFPLGSALKVKAVDIDTEHNVVSVTGRFHPIKDITDVKVGDKLPARIIMIADSYLLLDLGNDLKGISFVTEALDDYSVSLKTAFENRKNSIVPATVISVDLKDKKVKLSLRSTEPKDREIKSYKDLSRGDVVRGFIKAVSDKGIFVYLSTSVQAFVPVSKLTDSFIKDWKKFYKPMQPVTGKVVNCEEESRILLTLKESEVNGDLNILKGYSNIQAGEIFEGYVTNVTDFGVFVKLNNTLNVTGLAHRSQIADSQVDDLSALFGEGDKVKAIVLKTNPEKKQVSLGLKASYFKKEVEENQEVEDVEMEDVAENESEEDEIIADVDYDNESELEAEPEKEATSQSSKVPVTNDGLSLSTGFDWTASILDQAQEDEESSEDEDFANTKKSRNRKKRRTNAVEDKTIDINTRAPESVSDFERLIMGNPNSSVVWMNYMAFQLQLSEVDKAREIAERALKTINFRDELEKLNIWIAMLNLENTFGTEETLDDAFKRSCQYMDSFTMHNKLISIYQLSEKFERAAELYRATAKKFGSEKVSIWVSWGEFLISRNQNDEAHAVLGNALKALPKRDHIEVVRKFAQLEFSKGDAEQGRSLFEGLLADAPKRIDLWNVYIDQETKAGEKKKVEDLFERIISKKITRKQAKFFFNKWLQFEESKNDQKAAEYVKAKAAEYVQKSQPNVDEE